MANVKLVGESGILYPVNWDMIVGAGDYLDNTELFGNTQLSGSMLFSVKREEQELIFLYYSFYEYPFFMSLPDLIIE